MRVNFEDIEEYRLLEVNEAVFFIRTLINNTFDGQYIKGAMDMLKRIIKLPENFAKTEEQKLNAKAMTAKLFDEFEKKTIRRLLEE